MTGGLSLNHPPRVTVVGSFAVGFTMRAPRFPQPGETVIGSHFASEPGGKGSNQAVGAARLGAEAKLVAAIGQDAMGEIGVALWNDEGIDTTYLRRLSDLPTGAGFITVNAAGENTIVVDLGANLALSPSDVDAAESLIASSNAVLAVLEIPVETAARAMEIGRAHRVPTILNPAPAQALDHDILQFVDILTPNRSELRILAGYAPDDAMADLTLVRELQRRGAQAVVATRGKDGALVVPGDGDGVVVPSLDIDVVDTTGAGDAFSSALAVGIAEGLPLVDAATFAGCAGALTCTRLGVVPALPIRQSVDDRLRARTPRESEVSNEP